MSNAARMTVDKMAAIAKSIGGLAARSVLVGIPQTKAPREGDPMNNATIGFIMENGSPAANIPERPWLVPGVKDAQSEVVGELRGATGAALDGNLGGVSTHLDRAGLVAQNAVRARINSGDFVPLAESTIRARARRGRKGAKRELDARLLEEGLSPAERAQLARERQMSDSANVKPLIDTGQFRNSVGYVVR